MNCDYGMYIYKREMDLIVSVPHTRRISFKIHELDKAIKERDRICAIEGIDPYRFKLSKNGGRLGRPSTLKIHTDLPQGITRTILYRNGRAYPRIVSLLSTPYKKIFSYPKIRTEEKAIEMAIAWRDFHQDLL